MNTERTERETVRVPGPNMLEVLATKRELLKIYSDRAARLAAEIAAIEGVL